jgi:hypothetical protein
MADESLPTDRTPDAVCPWCSAALTPDATVCPSCGANLTSDSEDLPGLTAVDAALARAEKPARTRSRLLSWISGEYPDEAPSETDATAIALPDADVQREILRLELAAQVANLQAEADARLSEAVAEGRVPDLPEGLLPYASVDVTTDTPQTTDAPDGPAADEAPSEPAPADASDSPAADDPAPDVPPPA